MQFRVVIAASAALVCSACANDRAPQVLGFQAHAVAPQQTASASRDAPLPPLKKTMASKVLAAIALERVTGRKPDPSRLAELN